MEIMSKPFGRINIDERQILEFPRGLMGFEGLKRYALMDSDQPPFYWLQSLDIPDVAFVIISPYVFRPDYVLNIPGEDADMLEFDEQEDLLTFAICTIPENPKEMTANLQGPLVINRKKRIGIQSISLDSQWQIKHGVLKEMDGGE